MRTINYLHIYIDIYIETYGCFILWKLIQPVSTHTQIPLAIKDPNELIRKTINQQTSFENEFQSLQKFLMPLCIST